MNIDTLRELVLGYPRGLDHVRLSVPVGILKKLFKLEPQVERGEQAEGLLLRHVRSTQPPATETRVVYDEEECRGPG